MLTGVIESDNVLVTGGSKDNRCGELTIVMIKRRWLNILAKGKYKQHTLQQRQREQLEQSGAEMEAAEALLQEAGKLQAILKKAGDAA